MSRLDKKLIEWQSHGLLSGSQVSAILSYEDSLPKINWAQIGFLILGLGTIALGVISLIAYNWSEIPNSIKLTVGFALLFGIAIAVYQTGLRKNIALHNGLIALLMLYVFAMIGLIAQVYHLSGPGYQTGLVWSALTLLLVTCAGHILVPALWTLIFSVSLLWGSFEWRPLKEIIAANFPFFILLLSVITLTVKRFHQNSHLYKCLEFTAITSWIFGFLLSALGLGHGFTAEPLIKIWPHVALSGAILVLVVLDSNIKKIVKGLFTALVFLLLVSSYCDTFYERMKVFESIIGMLGFAIWALIFIAYAHHRLFNLMMAFVAYKIFEVFLINASGLLATGTGLVITGSLAVAAVYVWNKKKDNFERYLQALIK